MAEAMDEKQQERKKIAQRRKGEKRGGIRTNIKNVQLSQFRFIFIHHYCTLTHLDTSIPIKTHLSSNEQSQHTTLQHV
jgi:hypothetical protein